MSVVALPDGEDRHLRRYGHITARLEDKVILWGGQQFPSGTLWIYNIKRQKWGSRETYGDIPPRLSGSCSAVVGHNLFIFGGVSMWEYVNTVYCLNFTTFIWIKVMPDSGIPSPRDKLGCWVTNQKIVYFGGYGIPPSNEHIKGGKFIFHDGRHGWNNDLVRFDTNTNTWSGLPHSNSHTPSPRAAHACTNVSDIEGYLYGGRNRDERLNDLYSLSFLTHTWCRVITSSVAPQGRTWHSFVSIDRTFIFLHGGFNTAGETLDDSWLFNAELKNWREMGLDTIKQKRMWHTSCQGIAYGEILIFGGCEHFPVSCSAGMRIFNLSPLSLKRLALDTICKNIAICGSFDNLPAHLKSEVVLALKDE